MAGVYYMKTNAYNKFDVLYNAAGGLSLLTHDDIDTKTWAAYADASYSLTDAFSVDGGRPLHRATSAAPTSSRRPTSA